MNSLRCRCFPCIACPLHFDEASGLHIVNVAVDGNCGGHQRMVAELAHIVNEGLLGGRNRKPLDVFARARPRTLSNIAKAVPTQPSGLEAVSEQPPHHVICEEPHAAIRVMDYKEFSRTKQFVADDEGTDSIIAGPAPGITDHVRVAFSKSGELGGIEACIHACQHGKAACGWQGEFAFLAEALAVSLICSENLI